MQLKLKSSIIIDLSVLLYFDKNNLKLIVLTSPTQNNIYATTYEDKNTSHSPFDLAPIAFSRQSA